MYSVVYSIDSKKDLKELSVRIAQRIIKKIAFYAEQIDIKPFCKPLQGFRNRYRFRIGEYRAIFSIDPAGALQILTILKIKNRKDIYDL